MEGDPTVALWPFGTLRPGNSICEDVLANSVLDTVSENMIQRLRCEERERRLEFLWIFRKIVRRRTTNRSQNYFGLGGALEDAKVPGG